MTAQTGDSDAPGIGRWRRLLSRVVPVDNPAGAVYGLLIVGALLAAESVGHESYARTEEATAIALLLYWLAHSYARLLGGRLARGERLRAGAIGRALLRELPIIRGAAFPAVAVLVCWAAGVPFRTGITVGIWCSAVGIFVLEVAAGVRAHLRPLALLAESAVSAAMGLAILELRVLLH